MLLFFPMELLLAFAICRPSAIPVTGPQVVFPRSFNSDDSCITSNDRPGNCIVIHQCRILIEQRNLGALRRSLCGFEEKDPKVCCPTPEDDENSFEHAVSPKGLNSNDSDVLYPTLASPSNVNTKLKPISSPHNVSGGTQAGRRSSRVFPTDCGKNHVTFRRIVGGHESEVGAWPWMAVIYYVRRRGITAECGGVLITEKHILTAAHCVVSSRRGTTMRPAQLKVRLGDHDIDRTDDGADHIDLSVQSILKIDNFDVRTFQNDIAILVLRKSVTFTDYIAPICIPFDVFKDDDLAQRNAFVAGWGTLSYGGQSSSTLQEVQVRIWENPKCRHVFRREVPITDANLCAGDGDKDACRGDSGGPLMLAHKDGKFYIIGIVSFGKKCAEPGVPGVYTRVSTFLDWIEQTIESTS